MAYESVDVNKLKAAIGKIDDIKSRNIDNLKNSLSIDDWYGTSRARVKNALDELSYQYKYINEKVEKIRQLPSLIDEYKRLQNNNNRYEERKANLKKQYNNTDSENSYKRNGLQKDINWFTENISSNKSKMAKLQNQINNLIN